MFNGKYNLNQTSPNLKAAFGISDERYKEIMYKLNAIANIYPKYVPVIEVWLNANQFSDMEKAFGLFCLGKLFGMGILMKRAKVKVRYPIGDKEGELLTKLFTSRRELETMMKRILAKGNN